MDISIFDVIGPVMVGPSSSHTAGAVRLARIAKTIAGKPFSHVSFGLHGSFAKTYQGHGTDLALVAGALGLMENDETIATAFSLAQKQQITYDFYETELEYMHENSVRITFHLDDGTKCEVIGSSIGGAQVIIRAINGFSLEFSGSSPTLIIQQNDKKGMVGDVSRILAENDINIALMKLSRNGKGKTACWVIETDSPLSDGIVDKIRGLKHIITAQAIWLAEEA